MTEDEQEALSCKYVMPRVMRLSSGNIALLFSDGRLSIFTQHEMDLLYGELPSYEELPEARRLVASPVARKATLNLADLGL